MLAMTSTARTASPSRKGVYLSCQRGPADALAQDGHERVDHALALSGAMDEEPQERDHEKQQRE